MPLQDQTLNISFNKAINQKTDPKQILPGELLVLENGTFISDQQIVTKDGSTALTRSKLFGGTLSTGSAIGTLNDSLVLLDGTTVFSYGETQASWAEKGSKLSSSIQDFPVGTLAGASAPAGVLHSSGMELITWFETSSGGSQRFRYAYVDTSNNTVSYSTRVIAQVSGDLVNLVNITPLVFGTNFSLLLESRGTYNRIGRGTLPVTPTQTAPTQTTLISLSTTTVAPVKFVQTATDFYVLYDNTSGYPTIAKYNSSYVLQGSAVVLESATFTSSTLILDSFTNRLWAVWSNGTDLKATLLDSSLNTIATLSQLATGAYVRMAGVASAANTIVLYTELADALWSPSTAPNTNIIQRNTLSYDGVIGFSLGFTVYRGVTLGSVPVLNADGNIYTVLARVSPLQSTAFIMSFKPSDSTFGIVGKYAWLKGNSNYSITVGASVSYLPPISPVQLNSTTLLLPHILQNNTTISNGVIITSNYNVNQAVFQIGPKPDLVELGNDLHMTGGISTIYDGKSVVETGFNLFPETVVLTKASTTGFISNGTYSVVALYEWTDNSGNLWRSSPSTPTSITVTSGTTTNVIDAIVEPLSLTAKQFEVSIVVYRTVNGGTIYYRAGRTLQNPTGGNVITMTAADANITGNEQLYTTGGEVENIAPPAFSSITSFKNRLIGINAENPLEWWYSKQVIQGYPVEFSDLFTQVMDQRGGPITVVSTMDDKLIFFKEYNIFYVIGDGPSPSGSNNDFSYPQIITTDSVGCIDRDSVVLIPNGLMFKSRKGIYLLDRGLGCSYIGAPVEDFNSQTVVSSLVVPNTTQVRFSLSSGDVLMYDYLYNKWSVFPDIDAVDSVIYSDKYTILKSTGLVLEETHGVYGQNGAVIPLTLETGWLSLANLQGFQRLKEFLILFESASDATMVVKLYKDFEETEFQTDTIPVTGSSERFQFTIFPQIQKCEAMKVRIAYTPSAVTSSGLSISALALTVGIKKGLVKTSAANSYGG